MNEIADYKPQDEVVLSVDGREIECVLEQHECSQSGSIQVSDGENSAWARVVEIAGKHRVRAQLLHAQDWVRPGVAVVDVSDATFVPVPSKSATIEALGFSTDGVSFSPRRPTMAELSGLTTRHRTGHDALDTVAPLTKGGFNLVIDQTGGLAFDALRGSVQEGTTVMANLGDGGDYTVDGNDAFGELMSLRIAAAWAAWLRDQRTEVTLIARLPVARASQVPVSPTKVQRVGRVTDDLLEALASTKETSITVLLGLILDPSEPVSEIIETLSLGQFDTQIFVDAQGDVDLLRSTSGVTLDSDHQRERSELLAVLSRAFAIREKTSIFGEDDLSRDDLKVLDRAQELRVNLWSDDQRS